MLQAQGDGLAQRHLAIKLVSSLFKFDFLQKTTLLKVLKVYAVRMLCKKSENIIAKCR